MERKLIAIDLDGTTLNNESKISSYTKEVLQKAAQAGHIVSIVTGRPNRISENFYDELNIPTPMINFNGALGHIPHKNWDKEYIETFSKDIALDYIRSPHWRASAPTDGAPAARAASHQTNRPSGSPTLT